ncbi:dipeptidase 2-like isoform X2 [Bufo bufo]|nr:dipeptidase 2-like isoform X2 [Bufo bufo]XP_040264926.1 dipeptidase 2-like isoform X2 [Bufo bufo]XP_040264927.1 dipeptidase 2-like isoform X2 [Bufo bufo]XP_040264928.1 dipeptidase 2-like isoform X2 [Bufo bufo]XP_040264929.1 dipeptidase 2-like isoform X2 [Bufo bufo]
MERIKKMTLLATFLLCFFIQMTSCSTQKTQNLMKSHPLIDGHNDLALQLRRLYRNKLSKINLETINTTRTNLHKLKTGHVGAQFWSAYVLCGAQDKDAVRLALEQIDVIKRMCNEYEELEFVTSSQGIKNTEKIACLIGLEGGHIIDSSLAALRMFYDLGARYMTLTHTCNTPWAQTSGGGPHKVYQGTKGLTEFGKEVVKEMNRIGMIIDLSHTSFDTSREVLAISQAPVIFSHSAAYALCGIERNVPNDILIKIKENNGMVMVNFHTAFIACGKTANISTLADHFHYIKTIIGAEYIGFGGDYDGVTGFPEGLEDVSKYPLLVEELLRRGWQDSEIKAILRENFLRVFGKVEQVRDEMLNVRPSEAEISEDKLNYSCRLDLRKIQSINASGIQEISAAFTLATCILSCIYVFW